MYEVQCLDQNGNTINHFTQWDINQTIVIPIDDYEFAPDSPEYTAPEVHFANKTSMEALVVRSTVIDEHTIEAEVPNKLLQEPYPLFVFVYLMNGDDEDSKSEDSQPRRTVLHNEIPIRKRVKPSEYEYVENITPITAQQIKNEIWNAVNANMNETFGVMQKEMDDFESSVNTFLNDKSDYIDSELDKVHDRMDVIESSFKTTTENANTALENANTALTNVNTALTNVNTVIDDVESMKAKSEEDSKVYHVEEQTLYAENLTVEQNMVVGNFIWVNQSNGNMSLKWIGGEA